MPLAPDLGSVAFMDFLLAHIEGLVDEVEQLRNARNEWFAGWQIVAGGPEVPRMRRLPATDQSEPIPAGFTSYEELLPLDMRDRLTVLRGDALHDAMLSKGSFEPGGNDE